LKKEEEKFSAAYPVMDRSFKKVDKSLPRSSERLKKNPQCEIRNPQLSQMGGNILCQGVACS